MKMNSYTLSQFGLPKRIPPRPLELQQDNYLELFDDDILFYDIFFTEGKLIFLAPAIEDMVWEIIIRNLLINNQKVICEKLKQKKLNKKDTLINTVKELFTDYKDTTPIDLELYRSNKIHKLIISIKDMPKVSLFGVKVVNLVRYTRPTSCSDRVLYTTQKNNEVDWIVDWASWHIEYHEVNTVIVYDNNSDKYSISELQAHLDKLGCQVIVLSMPFKYGPGAYKGSAWDSDYYQYFAFEHARYAICQSAARLLNMDIDELLITESGNSIFNEVVKNSSVALFEGRWVEIGMDDLSQKSSHHSHNLLDRTLKCPNKWVVNLCGIKDSTFLRVHDVAGKVQHKKQIDDAKYFHFRSISTDWKYKRQRRVEFDASVLKRIDISNYNSLGRALSS